MNLIIKLCHSSTALGLPLSDFQPPPRMHNLGIAPSLWLQQSVAGRGNLQWGKQSEDRTHWKKRRPMITDGLYYIMFFNVEGFCVIADCLYGHDEYYGASAELGLRSWAHCTGVQLKQVETVVFSLPVIQHHLQWALGVTWRETKVNIRHYKLRKGERVQDCI